MGPFIASEVTHRREGEIQGRLREYAAKSPEQAPEILKCLAQDVRDRSRLRRVLPQLLRRKASLLVRDGLYFTALAAYRGQQGPSAYTGERQIRYAALTELIRNIDRMWRDGDTTALLALARQTEPAHGSVDTDLDMLVGPLWDRQNFLRAVMGDVDVLVKAGAAELVDNILSWLPYANADAGLRALRVTPERRELAVKRIDMYLRNVSEPDPEAIVRRTLLALGYPKRKAMSLFEATDKRTKRAALRSDE